MRILSQIRHNGYIKLFILLKGNAYIILYCCIDFVQSEGIRFKRIRVAPHPPSIILAAAHDEKATRPKGENVASTRADINVIEEGRGRGSQQTQHDDFLLQPPTYEQRHRCNISSINRMPACYVYMHACFACMHACMIACILCTL